MHYINVAFISLNYFKYLDYKRARGIKVVEALCYKLEGRVFETLGLELNFSSYLLLPVIMAIGDNNSESTQKLQMAITEVQRWTRKWRIKLNKTKSVHIDFTN
jgi:hypothetical protein